ncbi:hypothetical protein R1sor_005586 [Riccia sorocarpa]|uniref:DNA-directed RNA polymerase n=1 Tax=Riccia sorocarpa TaxID=122646 RepID=A0ABD3HJY5_9MARC
METAAAPSGGSLSWARITGIQFGLMSTRDIIKMSVTENSEASRAFKPRDVMVDAKLGLPTVSEQCLTCQGVTIDNASKICLNCGQPRKKDKTKGKQKAATRIQPMLLFRGTDDDDGEDSSTKSFSKNTKKRKRASLEDEIEKCPKENSGQIGRNGKAAGAMFKTPNKCKYCSASARDRGYPEPEIDVHVSPRGRGKDEVLSTVKAIKMSVTEDDLENIAFDFWNFVEGSSSWMAENSSRRSSRYLLPSEALKILQKIPEKRFADLDMKADIARPEAFVLECIPIPPNCLRLQEDGFGCSGTNIGFKLGVDRTTKALERLLRKISLIKAARFSRPTFQAALMECSILQAYFQLYLREKGAPKAAAGKEKTRVDRSGRIQNSKGLSRWSLDWLKMNVIGKRSCYSARNVVAGDPFLSVKEIGVPLDVAKHVTCSERVTEINKGTLQKYVEIGQATWVVQQLAAL